MSILFVLIPLGLLLLGIAIWAFVWAVNHEQFDDLDRAASSILFEDESPPAPLREDESPSAPRRAADSPPPRGGFTDPPEAA